MSFIPGPSNRPDKPEFWWLSEIILANDAKASEHPDTALKGVVEKLIPIDVAEYVAFHRSLLAMSIFPSSLSMEVWENLHLTVMSAWLDGFTSGMTYQQKYGKAEGSARKEK